MIRDPSNKAIDVEKALGPEIEKIVMGVLLLKLMKALNLKNFFARLSSEKSSDDVQNIQEQDNDGLGRISFWSTNAVPQKIGKAFIFLYTIPSPQELRQQAQLSGPSRSTNANRPMMLMVKDGSEYSLVGGYVDNTIKQLLANNTQVSSENETEVTKFDVIRTTIQKEFSSKTGTRDFPLSITSKYLLYKPLKVKKDVDESYESLEKMLPNILLQ